MSTYIKADWIHMQEVIEQQKNFVLQQLNTSEKYQMAKKNILDRYLCSIDNSIMKSPVLASDGHYYQQANIVRFMSKHRNSPMTGLPFPSKQLIPDFQIKTQIENYFAASLNKQNTFKIEQFFIRRNRQKERQLVLNKPNDYPKYFQKEVYTKQGLYIGSWKNGKMHGKGKIQLKSGGFYEGQFIQGNFHGNGKLTLSLNQFYEGEFKRGKRSGIGKQVYQNGQSYEGAWLNDEKFGNAKLLNKQGNIIYEGNWKNDKRCGFGTSFSDQGLYEGEWLDNKKTGYGCMTYANGAIYKGEWKQNNWNGKGEYNNEFVTQKGTWINSIKNGNFLLEDREGSFEYVTYRNNQKVGQGYQQFSDGDYYVGEYNIYKEGLGKEKEGTQYYQGQFKRELREGFGKLYIEKQQKRKRKNVLSTEQPEYNLVYQGQFCFGQKFGYGTGYLKNGDNYSGYWRNGQKHGLGTLTLRNGTTFQGQFFRNSIRGKAKINYNNGDRYEGQVRFYKRHGFGRLITHQGDVQIGFWQRNNFRQLLPDQKKNQNTISVKIQSQLSLK